ncbi:hypothetical protein LEP1GSC168_0795 [Leptospira santarosai str. HAI134]|nr:hypothetical protein LEP1GSC168_0795 [Leptospira santarosai str. HAI134]
MCFAIRELMKGPDVTNVSLFAIPNLFRKDRGDVGLSPPNLRWL